MFTVGADTAHLGSQVNDDFRLAVIQHSPNGIDLDEVVLFDGRDENIRRAEFTQPGGDEGTEKTGAAGDAYAFILPEMSFT